ncbi:hypothetical protein C1645_814920 [Glomus cerebriforme]|uniref:Attractin/MKLN-like beta-propeller domain-containing protein n=1 Tax=Glomus cerebriforme TaxID=658196 RepID=A0A397TIH7_9GLOM|nr:hypothetical protein C1645_814920 [Glomus cerebriforme]
MTPFKPSRRHLHTATYVDNKLYILSGFDDSIGIKGIAGISGKQFFYLDVSVPVNTQEISWNDLTNVNMISSHVGAGSVKGGTNNKTIILYRGKYLTDVENDASVYTNLIENNEFVNDMLILDSINLSWGKGSTLNAPVPRNSYAATLLPNKNIIYIGGATFNGQSLTLNEVYMYDTINDNWSTKNTSGSIPSNRAGLSAVLGLDGQRVIIFGGYGNGEIVNSQDSLYVLNINTFEWSIPKISGNITSSRYLHKANLIGNYMVISFGVGYQSESDILLLDISNNDEYKWTTKFNPPQNSSKNNIIPLISIFMGSLVGGILLSIGIFFLHKRREAKKNLIQIPDKHNSYKTSDYSQAEQEVINDLSSSIQNIDDTMLSFATTNDYDKLRAPESDDTLGYLRNEMIQAVRPNDNHR